MFALLLCEEVSVCWRTARQVKVWTCSAWAKAIIQRCIGKRQRRFANAAEMLRALSRDARLPVVPMKRSVCVRSLEGKRVVFTGRLKMLRKKARTLLKRAGGISQAKITRATDILVVGEQSPNWKAEKKGQKLLDLDHEGERGHRIAIITEARFRNLVSLAGFEQSILFLFVVGRHPILALGNTRQCVCALKCSRRDLFP